MAAIYDKLSLLGVVGVIRRPESLQTKGFVRNHNVMVDIRRKKVLSSIVNTVFIRINAHFSMIPKYAGVRQISSPTI